MTPHTSSSAASPSAANPSAARFEPLPECCSDAYERYRQYIEHENTLVNFRTTWAVASNSFLLVAYGATLSGTSLTKAGVLSTGAHTGFLYALALAGFLVNLTSFFSVEAAFRALQSIEEEWGKLKIEHPLLPPITGAGKAWVVLLGHAGARVLLLALSVIWAGLGAYTFSLRYCPASSPSAFCQAFDLLEPRV
ncbi:MAG TPA: hypothetical protein VGK33_00010 [Chloroflexota bacterium]